MRPARQHWTPRYELRLVRGEAVTAPILVWSRHRCRALAVLSKRMEEDHLDLGAARLVLYDRWRARVDEGRARFSAHRSRRRAH